MLLALALFCSLNDCTSHVFSSLNGVHLQREARLAKHIYAVQLADTAEVRIGQPLGKKI